MVVGLIPWALPENLSKEQVIKCDWQPEGDVESSVYPRWRRALIASGWFLHHVRELLKFSFVPVRGVILEVPLWNEKLLISGCALHSLRWDAVACWWVFVRAWTASWTHTAISLSIQRKWAQQEIICVDRTPLWSIFNLFSEHVRNHFNFVKCESNYMMSFDSCPCLQLHSFFILSTYTLTHTHTHTHTALMKTPGR